MDFQEIIIVLIVGMGLLALGGIFFRFMNTGRIRETHFKKLGFLLNALLLVFVGLLGNWALGSIKEKIDAEVKSKLQSVMNSTAEALNIWVETQSKLIIDIAAKPEIVRAAEAQILNLHGGRPLAGNPDVETLRNVFKDYHDRLGVQGFFIISKEGFNIGSMRDDNLGKINLIKEQEPKNFAEALKGRTKLIHPIVSDIPLKGIERIAGTNDYPTMFMITPITNGHQEVIALLAMRFNPAFELSSITKLGRIGKTGETYLFDEQARMLTESRFIDDLRSIGILKVGEQSILSVQIRDPEVNLKKGEKSPKKMAEREFTKMAKSALARETHYDLNGYLDYRGVPVVGAWVWLDQFHLGVTTEQDLEEAMAPYDRARLVIIILLVVTMMVSFLITMLLISVSKKANQSLLYAQDKLEEKVRARTEDLWRVQLELEEKESRFRSLVSNIPGVVYRCDMDAAWTMKYMSEYIVKLTGYPAEEFLYNNTRTFASVIHPEDVKRVEKEVEKGLQKDNQYTIEYRIVHKSGQEFWVFEQGQIIHNAEGEVDYLDGFILNLSDRKALEEQLVEAKDKAVEANRAKSSFLASMSHEIRTPLNGVIGMQSLLLRDKMTEVQRQKLEVANNSAQSLLNLLNDILDFSKIEANKLEFEEIDFNLIQLFEDFVQSVIYRCDSKGIELLLDLTGIQAQYVKGDPTRLRQLLNNLVGNAIKFTSEGEVLIKAELLNKEGAFVLHCLVQDSGIGIPEENIGGLFEQFTQVDASTTRKYGGTGLGLAICKRLTELMGGCITVESVEGKGSTFSFSIVLKEGVKSELFIPDVNLKGLKVLVVDDNRTNRAIYANQLEVWGCVPQVAENAKEVFGYLNMGVSFDVALFDMNMPNMDGLQLMDSLRENYPLLDMKSLLLTSSMETFSPDKYQKRGFVGCFTKPVPQQDLYKALCLLASSEEKFPFITHGQLSIAERHGEGKLKDERKLRVLLVEDNEVNRMVAEGMLKEIQFPFGVAENGKEAIAELQKDSYDFVLMDCQMPVMDGFEATREIRKGAAGLANKNIPIIALTANAMKGDQEACFAAGMNDYLSKPLEIRRLEQAINKLLANADFASTGEVSHTAEEAIAESDEEESLGIVVPHGIQYFDFRNNASALLGQPEVFIAAMGMFVHGIQGKINKVIEAQKAKDAEALRQAVHSIKGSMLNFNVLEIPELANDIELLARNEQRFDAAQMELFLNMMKGLEETMKKILAANESMR